MSTHWFKFHYTDSEGRGGTDTIRAQTLRLATQYLISKRYNLKSIRKLSYLEIQFKKIQHLHIVKILFRPRLSRQQLYWFTKELHDFIKSGLPLFDALNALTSFSKKKSC